MSKPKIFVTSCCKGGVGKSTLLLHLAEVLTNQPRNRTEEYNRNKRVLIVDTDAQGNCTHYYGKSQGTLYDSLVNNKQLVVEHTENPLVDIVTADRMLALADVELSRTYNGRDEDGIYRILASKLMAVKDNYDVILIDTAPNLGTLTMNAMYCADTIIVPCVAEPFGVEGLQLTLDIKRAIDGKRSTPLDLKIVITRRRNTALQTQVEEAVRNTYGELVCRDVMHEKAVYAENSLRQCHAKMLNSEMRYLPFGLGIY